MQWQSHVNYYGVSSCNEILSTSGFTNLTVHTAGCGAIHSTKKYQRIFFSGLVLSNGESITFRDGSQSGPVIAQISGPFNGTWDTGCIFVSSGKVCYEYVVASGCSDDSDCDAGEKCVDGQCFPCDEQQATHFQIRAEFEELVTLPDGSQTMYLLSSVYPIGSGVSNQIIQLAECNGVWYYPRIRFCDASGVIKPYTGALAFYGYCNPDGSTALWVNNFNAVEQSHFLGQRAQMDLHFASPLSVPRILVEFIEPSAVILEPDCSSVTPEDPPDIEPVEPDDPEEPDEPTEPDEPIEPDEPDKPTPPPQLQDGLCPCEEYIGLQIKRAADILYDGLILLKRELSVVGREIVVELWEKRKMDYQLSMFFQNQQFQLMHAHHQRLFEIRQILESIRDDIKKGLIKDNEPILDLISDSLRLTPCEPDYPDGKTIAQIADDFEKHYYPATVEVLENDVVLDTGSDEPDIFCRKLRN